DIGFYLLVRLVICVFPFSLLLVFFFFNDTATTEIYTLSLHDALPINELIHRAGFWALVFLGATLAVTPFRRVFRYGNLIDIRRMLGVGTFCYIAAHLALFFADQG